MLANFDNTWTLTETLLSALKTEESFFRPPYHGLRHPMIFYYGHPAALYVNKMRVSGLVKEPINAAYETLFETGVDEMSWDDMSLANTRWPSISQTHEFRARVYEMVRKTIETHPAFDSLAEAKASSPFWSVVMGIDHERIHIETSSVLIRELPLRLVQRPPAWPRLHESASRLSPTAPRAGVDYPAREFVQVPGGRAVLGKPAHWPSFGWDLEYGKSHWTVPAFEATRYKITNGEMLEFVADSGYLAQRWWCDAGWAWRSFRNLKWPTFWRPSGPQGMHEYKLRTLFEEIAMPWSWPAEVNYYEAAAFARWSASKCGRPLRVLTELEHARMRDRQSDELKTPADDHAMRADTPARHNLAMSVGSPSPVDAYPLSAKGFGDLWGNVWEWCEDHMSPLTGYATHPYYPDFAMPCFDGRHHVIVGGSFMSAGDEASAFARFHFRPHFFQHAGFRLVAPNAAEPAGSPLTSCTDNAGPYVGSANPYRKGAGSTQADGNRKYEDRAVLHAYLAMHYAPPTDYPDWVPRAALDFPRRCAEALTQTAKRERLPTRRALDVGCAVGRSAFELARVYDSVRALDISAAFVEAANGIKASGQVSWTVPREGELTDSGSWVLEPVIDRSRVNFAVGDATKLDATALGGAFDAVLIGNVLCRLPDPRKLLDALPSLVVRGGLLFMSSPFSWSERFTPRELWLGGRRRPDCSEESCEAALAAYLAPHFDLVWRQPMPFAIREHVRKYELVAAHAALWRRK